MSYVRVLVTISVICATHGVRSLGADLLYYTNQQSVLSANLDGSNVQTLISGLSTPRGIDVTEQFIYWADSSNGLFRADLDGSNVNQLNSQSLFQHVEVHGSYLYAQRGFSGLYRYDLDGTNETLIAGWDNNNGLTVTDSAIYFARRDTLFRVDLDGSNLSSLTSFGVELLDVEVDGGRIYLSDRVGDALASVDLLGGDLQVLYDGPGSANNSLFELAVLDDNLYVANFTSDVVQTIPTNGGALSTLIADTDPSGRPWGVAIGPSAVPEPSTFAMVLSLGIATIARRRRR
ncbi:MAG: DUF5050 domain-containing protein [Planctomycetota bacterium]